MIMKKKTIIILFAAILFVAGSIFTVRCVRDRNSSPLFLANFEALVQIEQPNINDCVDDPEYTCIALHPTDPDKDLEKPYSRWP